MTTPFKTKKPAATADAIGDRLPTITGDDIGTAPDLCPGAQMTSGDDPIQWFAVAIAKGWQKNVRAILELSKLCAEADNVLDMAAHMSLIDRLPFGRTVFCKLAAIGRCHVLHNPEVEASLPPNYTTLYIARKLSAEELDRAVARKVLSPDCSREALRHWVSDANNCRYGAATRPPPDRADNAAETGKLVMSLLEAWKASSILVEQWRHAPDTARNQFVRELKKL